MRRDGAFHLSDFSGWRGCDKRYELEVLGGATPAFRHPAALNGVAIHRVVDQVHAHELWDIDSEGLSDAWAAAFEWAIEHPVNPEEAGVPIRWGEFMDEAHARSTFARDALAMVRGYMADPRNREAEVLVAHGRWRAKIGGALWAGELDQVRRESDGSYSVIDLKTGQDRPSGPPLELWAQVGYSLALRDAEFLRFDDEGEVVWTPISIQPRRVAWLHMRDYIPYLRSGKTSSGRTYRAGEMRGQAFYYVDVNAQSLEGIAREMGLFTSSVARGDFPRRPSSYECARCHVRERCLASYRGEIDAAALRLTEEDFQDGQ